MSDRGDDVQALLGWITRADRREFSTRDVGCNFARFKEDPAVLDDALKWMIEKNLIRPIDPPSKSGPGRKPTPRFEANPALWNRLQNHQEHQNDSGLVHIEGNEGFEGGSEGEQ